MASVLPQSADPEVDGAETGGGNTIQVLGVRAGVGPLAGAVEEVETICWRGSNQHVIARTEDPIRTGIDVVAQHEKRCRRALVLHRGRPCNGRVCAVGRDEVNEEFRVLEMHGRSRPSLM